MTIEFKKPLLHMEIYDSGEFLKAAQKSFKFFVTKRAILKSIRIGLGRHAPPHLTEFLQGEIARADAHLESVEDDIAHWTEIIDKLERRNPRV